MSEELEPQVREFEGYPNALCGRRARRRRSSADGSRVSRVLVLVEIPIGTLQNDAQVSLS